MSEQSPPIVNLPVSQATYQQLIDAAGLRILAGAIEQGPLFAPYTFQRGQGDLFVMIHVGRNCANGKRTREWTPCERDIFLVLENAKHRMTGPMILAEMEKRGILHGDSTLTHALGLLVREGVLRSSRKNPRGYWIAPQTLIPKENTGAA